MYSKKIISIIIITLILILSIGITVYAQNLGDRTLREGMTGEDIREAQTMLKDLGFFHVNPTGYFGPITSQAVIDFQSAKGLNTDGIAGPITIERLKLEHDNFKHASALEYTSIIKYGMSGNRITSLQKILAELGYFKVNPTGYFGMITKQAVEDFQRDQSLVVDGIVGRFTVNAINNELNNSRKGNYTVKAGDTLWLLANTYSITIEEILRANSLTSTILYVGQVLIIPSIPDDPPKPPPVDDSKPYITYDSYTVVSGDNIWSLSIRFGITVNDLFQANNLSQNSSLKVGQVLKIPVFNIPIKPTPTPNHGEYLDWWTEAQYLWTTGTIAEIEDFYTGVKWKMKRTFGGFHADVEPLTAEDTAIMKSVWGGNWSWGTRPILVHINGRKIAASASAMPHDVQQITDNNFNGHSDVHFKNSTRHKDNLVDWDHQAKIKIAAGIE